MAKKRKKKPEPLPDLPRCPACNGTLVLFRISSQLETLGMTFGMCLKDLAVFVTERIHDHKTPSLNILKITRYEPNLAHEIDVLTNMVNFLDTYLKYLQIAWKAKTTERTTHVLFVHTKTLQSAREYCANELAQLKLEGGLNS